MWQPGVGNSQSRRRFSPEVSGMRTPGHGIPQTGRKKYQRADKKDGIIRYGSLHCSAKRVAGHGVNSNDNSDKAHKTGK